MKRSEIGMRGELAAAGFLRKSGYEILAANYRTRQGEIDLIASDGEYLVFAEVKTRRAGSMLEPREAVTRSKQQKIILAAQQYLLQNDKKLQPRFDVVEVVTKSAEGFEVLEIRHLKNAFSL